MWHTVELREIRIFLALAEELHFGRTADRLQISQSRVSQAISTLETRVGGRLFERTSRRVRLTPVGEQLRAQLAPPYRQLERAFASAQRAATGIAGVLRVGMYMRTSAGPHWSQIVRSFTTSHPDCEVQILNTGFDRSYLDFLRQDEVDLLAVRLPLTDHDITIGPILTHEPKVLLVRKDDPLTRHDSVSVDDYSDRAVTQAPGMPREMLDAFSPPVTPSGHRLRRVTVHSTEEALMLIASGMVVHPTVPSFLTYHPDAEIVAVPIRDVPPSQTALAWVTANRSPKVHAFVRAASDVLAHTELAPHQHTEPARIEQRRRSDTGQFDQGALAPSRLARSDSRA